MSKMKNRPDTFHVLNRAVRKARVTICIFYGVYFFLLLICVFNCIFRVGPLDFDRKDYSDHHNHEGFPIGSCFY